jgi:hypothetical protein
MRIPPSRERGVVLIYTLIILLILTIGAVALVRSMHTSLFSAGNLAFHRDLANQGEQAVSNVLTLFQTGGFAGAATQADNMNANYSATMLPTTPQGVPNVLLNDGTFPGKAPDIIGPGGVTIRYIVDRLCNALGPSTPTQCVQSSAPPSGNQTDDSAGLPPPSATVYRVSVRVEGPRSTEVFLQTTFTKPD